MKKFKIGLVQMYVTDSKEKNLKKAEKLIVDAVNQGAELVVLPEMFNCPYQTQKFPIYAEQKGEKTWEHLASIAQKNKVYLIGGSIPEKDEKDRIYNTSFVFDNSGREIAYHRKVHLFDIDVKGRQYFKESDTLTPGDAVTVFDTSYGKMAVAICYDIRFPEFFRLMVARGAKIIIVPGAFNMTTGPAHWEILFRTRALDNQVYILGAAPARNNEAEYVSYGNSLVANPWGTVLQRLDEKEGILIQEIDLDLIEKIRRELPLLFHLRKDLYPLE